MPTSNGSRSRAAVVGVSLLAILIQCWLHLPVLLMVTPTGDIGQVGVLLAGVGTAGTSTPGGQRNVGRLFADLLVEMGADVACVARTDAAARELQAAGCRIAGVGDLTDATFAEQLVGSARPATIFTAVGGKDAEGNRIDGLANINLFRAAAALKEPPHVVFITSWGCGETWDFINDRTRQFLGPALRAKTEAEEFLRSSGLKHMIVRPGGLLPATENATRRGILIKGRPEIGGNIRRQDLAQMLLWLPRREETNGLAVTAIDQDMANTELSLQPEDIVAFAAPGER